MIGHCNRESSSAIERSSLEISGIGAVVKMRSTDENGAGTSAEHEQNPGAAPKKVRIVPHWNAILGLVAIGVIYAFLPTKASIGPSWFLLAVEGVFLVPFVIATLTGRRVSPVTLRVGSMILLGIVTLALVVGIGHLISTLKSDINGVNVIRTGVLLYGCNILVSALWYWEIDGGGPEKRQYSDHQAADFLFPQQMGGIVGNWAPHFFDYLYVAFTGATAFSPTDTMPLSRRAKFLMMVEAILALLLISFVVSRAINII
jgi:uncharacterized membrane protein